MAKQLWKMKPANQVQTVAEMTADCSFQLNEKATNPILTAIFFYNRYLKRS